MVGLLIAQYVCLYVLINYYNYVLCDKGKIPNGKLESEEILNDTNRFRDWVLSL